MSADTEGTGFKIWAVDDVVYGPVELPTLVSWIKDERVTAETWIYQEARDAWAKAAQVDDLKMFFRPKAGAVASAGPVTSGGPLISGLKPGMLRRVKILGDMNDQQLGRFIQFMEVQQAGQFREIVKQGDHGDAMYLILEGEVRVRTMMGQKESVLATMNAGEFFGDISLFDHGPRSADVVANQNSTLLKISAASLQKLVTEAPELATPFLVAICKTLTNRIRADNKRLRDSLNFARAAGSIPR